MSFWGKLSGMDEFLARAAKLNSSYERMGIERGMYNALLLFPVGSEPSEKIWEAIQKRFPSEPRHSNGTL